MIKTQGKYGQANVYTDNLENSAYGQMAQSDIPYELAYLYGEKMENYMPDMAFMQAFADLNRTIIKEVILDGMKLTEEESFTTIHNYIDTESMILRKGAVSAKADERLLIPMNMRDVSLICIGLGNEKWNYSAPYGAGRLLRRKEAFNSFTMDAYKNNTEVIFTTSVNKDTLDECPMVYKPMEEIMRNINGTVTVNKIIKPIYNFKASENAMNKKQIKEMTE